jgi:hypothetical protein
MLHPTTSKILLNEIKINLYNNLTADLILTQCLEEVTKEEEEDIVEVFVEAFVDSEVAH